MSFDANKTDEDSFALDVDEKNIWEKLMQGGDDEVNEDEEEEEEESLEKKLDEKLTKTLEEQKMEMDSEEEEEEEEDNADMNEFDAEFNSFMDLARKNLEATDSVESTDKKDSKSKDDDKVKKEEKEKGEEEEEEEDAVNPFASTEVDKTVDKNVEKNEKEKDEEDEGTREEKSDEEDGKKDEDEETAEKKDDDVKIDFNAEDFSLEKILKDVDSEIDKNEKIFDDDDGGDDKAFAIGNQGEDFFNTAGSGAADEGFADFDNFETKVKKSGSEESFVSEEEEVLDELPPFIPPWDYSQGWNFLLRQPLKKKFTQNRFWKPAYVRIDHKAGVPTIRIFPNDKDTECLFELELQITHTVCNVGLQQLDQFGKCHTVKIQQCNFKETIGLKSDRIAPTLMDLTKVRDLKGLKDLMHKPKTTMLLDHAHTPIELLKFGTTKYEDIKSFINAIEDILFNLNTIRGKSASYTKDEIEIEVRDEYYAEIDSDGHILNHKARVRLFCLAFLSESPTIEIGINDKRRRGKEVVSRIEIIPIKTEEWIKIENYELHNLIEKGEFEKTKVLKLNPLDACKFEILRFRTRPRINIELPLQIRAQMTIIDRHIEARVEVMVTGYYSHSSRAAQTPCENIQIRFPIPESWVYLFRVEKRFKYGAVHSAKRKAGKIKGIERITGFAQGNLPPSLIEVTSGLAKYEQAFHALVWRIDQLPERNEGAYKTHLMTMNLELAAHDEFPEELAKTITVEYSMLNSTVSKAQVRSISINSSAEDPPDRWVKHAAKFEYIVGIEFTDKPKPQSEDIMSSFQQDKPKVEETKEEEKKVEEEEDSSSSDSD